MPMAMCPLLAVLLAVCRRMIVIKWPNRRRTTQQRTRQGGARLPRREERRPDEQEANDDGLGNTGDGIESPEEEACAHKAVIAIRVGVFAGRWSVEEGSVRLCEEAKCQGEEQCRIRSRARELTYCRPVPLSEGFGPRSLCFTTRE
ncbi:hypothetical protein B0T22DRAFT_463652 [Podospora appendiculata]|uniref:Secreted protein n=1 Tax=Podospora appendiculata TaxID=314037 RepID=A0AAE0XDR1_9PEZI|nr:hypothetical protein B0T22DRAFT_463652 [Podospora appendiculata]